MTSSRRSFPRRFRAGNCRSGTYRLMACRRMRGDLQTGEIARNLAGISWRFGDDEIVEVLAGGGWDLISTAGPRRKWQCGDTVLHTVSMDGSVYRVNVYLDVWSREDVIDEDNEDWTYEELE